MDTKFLNVILLGIAFFFIFTSFLTAELIQQTVSNSINEEYHFNWNGYTSLCIFYAVFSLSNFMAPSVICLIGPKYAMIAGTSSYVIFIAHFLYPMSIGLYAASVITGFGAALTWTGQSNLLCLLSTTETIDRNTSIFWTMFQSSALFGNLFVYFELRGESSITSSIRITVYSVLTVVAVIGLLFLMIIKVPSQDVKTIDSEGPRSVDQIRKYFLLMTRKKMMLLCVTSFYAGLQLSFHSVYGTAIGNTKALGADSQKLIGISGMLIGVGEILGGLVSGFLTSHATTQKRDPVMVIGCAAHVVTCAVIFTNLPDSATLMVVDSSVDAGCNVYLALMCSFLLGFGDSCFMTKILAHIGSVYSHDSAPAFSVSIFFEMLAAAISFLYSSHIGLHSQVAIIAFGCVIGTITFCVLEFSNDSPCSIEELFGKKLEKSLEHDLRASDMRVDTK